MLPLNIERVEEELSITFWVLVVPGACSLRIIHECWSAELNFDDRDTCRRLLMDRYLLYWI